MVGNKAKKAIAAALSGAMVLGAATPALAGVKLTNNWYRVNGDLDTAYTSMLAGNGLTGGEDYKGVDRYDTMFDAVSFNASELDATQTAWAAGLDSIVLVSGDSYADTLSATALAGALKKNANAPTQNVPFGQTHGVPLVTTPSDKLGLQAERIIRYYAGKSNTTVDNTQNGKKQLTVYIVGGTGAVSAEVEAAVDAIDEYKDSNNNGTKTAVEVKVARIGGGDRQQTSLFVADHVDGILGASETADRVFVANGTAWADALSVSSYSYRTGTPILLTDAAGNLSTQQIQWLKDRGGDFDIDTIGGPAQLAYDALNAIDGVAGTVNKIVGADRYLTSAAVVEHLGLNGDLASGAASGTTLGVATGTNWPDALVGGAFIGAQDGTLVLIGDASSDSNWNAAVKQVIKQQNASGNPAPTSFDKKFIIGGTAAVNNGTETVLTGASL